MEKDYFVVTFKYNECVYCTNIAHAFSKVDAEQHYSNYEWVSARKAEDYEVVEARRRGMPFVEV